MKSRGNTILNWRQALYYAATRSILALFSMYGFTELLFAISGDTIADRWGFFLLLVVLAAFIFVTSTAGLLSSLPIHKRLLAHFPLSPLWPQKAGYQYAVRLKGECREFFTDLERLLQSSLKISHVNKLALPEMGFTCRVPFEVRRFAYKLRVCCGPDRRSASISITSYEPRIFNYIFPMDVDAARTSVVVLLLCAEHGLIEPEFEDSFSREQLRSDLGGHAKSVDSYLRRVSHTAGQEG